MSSLTRATMQVLLTAVPMGLLADRIGRKRVIATSIMGPLLSLSWIVFICELDLTTGGHQMNCLLVVLHNY